MPVAAHVEPFERGLFVFVVVSEISHLRRAMSTSFWSGVSGRNHCAFACHLWYSIHLNLAGSLAGMFA